MYSEITFQSQTNWKKAKVIIIDTDLLCKIPLENIKRYLKKTGWNQTGSMRHGSEWQYNADIKTTIIVPAHQNLVDYGDRVYDIFDTLELILNKRQIELFEELINCKMDYGDEV